MDCYPLNQLEPLPAFQNVEVGQTIGRGTYAIVKLGKVIRKRTQLVAIKYIHRELSHKEGINDEKIGLEVKIHKECNEHPNIIGIYLFGTDNTWVYMIMELAEGGDLFDKIEPDVGLPEDLANFYFKQLINAISFIHSKGVAHRDIKPENILLDNDGNLKLTDFGLATIYKKKGEIRVSKDQCGSLPYVAPEVIIGEPYDPSLSDIWGCGIVLFTLLTGQIAWEKPQYMVDEDYTKFVISKGKVLDEPWNRFNSVVRPLLLSILKPNPSERFTLVQIRLHPWVNQENALMNSKELCSDSGLLAERLLSNLQVSLSDNNIPYDEQKHLERIQRGKFISNSQPANNIAAKMNPLDGSYNNQVPLTQGTATYMDISYEDSQEDILQIVSKDPGILQFKNSIVGLQMSATQKRLTEFNKLLFKNIKKLTRFFSIFPIESLLSKLRDSLHRIGISTSDVETELSDEVNNVKISVSFIGERYKSQLRGNIIIMPCKGTKSLLRVDFVRSKGDPLEWRKFFKRIVLLSKDVVYVD